MKKRVLQFLSLGTATQLVMALNQLLLLPLQIGHWGHTATAQWYTALAVAAFIGVSDFGLRTAGHGEIFRYVQDGHKESRETFRANWCWIRILIAGGGVIVSVSYLIRCLLSSQPIEIWCLLLNTSVAIDTFVVIRIGYLDTLRRYNSAESTFLILAVSRLCFALIALKWLSARELEISAIYCFTGILGLLGQAPLCHRLDTLKLFGDFPSKVRWKTLTVLRHTFSGPLSIWCQIHLPVLVISSIATPTAVTIYVALRAAFGLARATIQQISRMASVEFLRISEREPSSAKAILGMFVFLGTAIGAVTALGTILDNHRILGLWIRVSDQSTFHIIALSLGIALPFYSYQMITSTLIRKGDLKTVARGQYTYIAACAFAALSGYISRSITAYLVLAALSEFVVAYAFEREPRSLDPRVAWVPGGSLFTQSGAATIVAATAAIVVLDPGGVFTRGNVISALWTGFCYLLALAALLIWGSMRQEGLMARVLKRVPISPPKL